MTFRIATKRDLSQILTLHKAVIRHMDEKGIKQWPDSYPNKEIFTSDITKKQLIVAELDGEIIAMLVLSPDLPSEYNSIDWKFTAGKINSIHRLAVCPKRKSPTLAVEMMNFAEKKAKEEGYDLIRLDTYSLNLVANAFYKKIGYRYCGDINLEFMPEKYFCYEKAI